MKFKMSPKESFIYGITLGLTMFTFLMLTDTTSFLDGIIKALASIALAQCALQIYQDVRGRKNSKVQQNQEELDN